MGNDITVKKNGVTFHYSAKVASDSQKAIEGAISNIFERSWKDRSLFDELYIDAYGTWDESDEFSNCNPGRVALTRDPVVGKGKTIYVRTNKTQWGDFGNNKIKDDSVINSVTHELGHLFDYYYATPDETIKDRLTEILVASETATNNEYRMLEKEYYQLWGIYCKQNSLSDSEEFREAWRKDVDNTFKGNSRLHNSITESKLGYFSPRYKFAISKRINSDGEIKLHDGIDDKELDMADCARAEIFAQLFAYAMGAKDSEKNRQLLVNTYKHSYEVVKNLINEYLGTNTEGHYVPRDNNLNCEF